MSNSAITQQVQGLATPTSPGLVGTGAQSFAGVKTFQDGLVPSSSMMFRNKLINGGFDIWQRGTSQTISGMGSDDRWSNANSGSTKTASRQTFTLGQTDVPGNPKYWSRTAVTSVAGASNFCIKAQKIESVLTLAGQTATVSFWAKADASKNMAVELEQSFGTGGSPSAGVTGLGITTCALTTSWQRFVITLNVPSVSGKVLGTNNDDFIAINFWFDAGSSFNARTNSLGQQSGTFDIANVQIEQGSAATPFELRPIGTELALCQRYYEKSFGFDVAPAANLGDNRHAIVTSFLSNDTLGFIQFKVTKRINPIVTGYSALSTGSNWHYWTGSTFTQVSTALTADQTRISVGLTITGTVGQSWLTSGQWAATAEI